MAVLLLGAVSCGKEKTCRCSVLGDQTVRIVKIEKGECEALHEYNYHNLHDTLFVDTLLCTDFEFEIDKEK